MNKTPPIVYYFKDGAIPERLSCRFSRFSRVARSAGPREMQGGLLITPFSDMLPEYTDNGYKWQEIAGCWVGIKNNLDPEDIAVEIGGVPGYMVKLGDGKQWRVPVALIDTPRFSLPRFESLDEKGEWKWKVQERYRDMVEMADSLWQSINESGVFSLEESDVRNICLMALAINYNINDIECSAMGLFTQEAYQGIIEAIVDKQGYREILEHLEAKKKLQGEPDTDSGDPAI
jgi:hypothetical protein